MSVESLPTVPPPRGFKACVSTLVFFKAKQPFFAKKQQQKTEKSLEAKIEVL